MVFQFALYSHPHTPPLPPLHKLTREDKMDIAATHS